MSLLQIEFLKFNKISDHFFCRLGVPKRVCMIYNIYTLLTCYMYIFNGQRVDNIDNIHHRWNRNKKQNN